MAVKTIQIPASLHAKLKRKAQRTGMKLGALVEHLLRRALAKEDE